MRETGVESLIEVREELQQVVRDARAGVKSLQLKIDAAMQRPPNIVSDPTWSLLCAHCCVTNCRYDFVSRKQLYALYKAICEEKGIKNPCSVRMFRRKLHRGWSTMFEHDSQNRAMGRGYKGLKIKAASMLTYSLEYS